jgi:hypothetical protein
LAISWLSSSVDVDGRSACISSVECGTRLPDAFSRFEFDGVVVADFLYGDWFCGLMVTEGTKREDKEQTKNSIKLQTQLRAGSDFLPGLCPGIIGVFEGGAGMLKLFRG